MLGSNVLTALYASLEKFHNITSDMLANRIDVMYSILEGLFGDKNARIMFYNGGSSLYANVMSMPRLP